MSNHHIKPCFCLLRLDETRHWVDDVAARAGCIFGLYVYDQNRRVHCCEFTPSYECLFVGSASVNTDHDDDAAARLAHEIREGDRGTEPVRYFHCNEIDALPEIGEHDLKMGVSDLGIDDQEKAVKYVRQRVL
jgi:hypothetical protein